MSGAAAAGKIASDEPRESSIAQVTAERDSLRAELNVHIHALPLALTVYDATEALTTREWNPAAERIFGFRRDEMLGRSAYDLIVPPEQHALVREVVRSVASSRDTVNVINQNITKDGRTIWCEWFNTALRDGTGKTTRILSMVQDITERVRAEERTRLWTSMLDQSAEGIMICDPELCILAVNAAFERITGFSGKEAIGKTPRILHSGRQSRAFYVEMWRSIVTTGLWRGEIWNQRKNGETYAQSLSVRAVYNEHGALTHYLGIFADVTERKATEARLQHLADYDSLTELPNRTLVKSQLRQLIEIATRTHGKLAVLSVDLNRFNNVNESMGRDVGDLVLQTVARRMTEVIRMSDSVARMGADEFLVLVSELRDESDAAGVSQAILDAIRAPMVVNGQELTIDASVGICLFPADGTDATDLVRNATSAMKRAKQSSHSAYEFYTCEMNERAAEQLRMENALRKALELDQLVLHYQPQVDLASGAIVGAEALIRWNRPGAGLVMPGQFIRFAQDRGLILLIGRWVIREAIRQLAVWEAAGLSNFTVAVNLTASEFHQKGFVEELARAIADQSIDAARLELELTESIAVHDIEAASGILRALHGLGVRLSLDDFGTGYSSLSYLRRFPIDKIKIDQSFIREMTGQPESIRTVRAIIGLAKSFGMKVIAEGVETAQQFRALRAEHCDEIQGFLASPALPPEEFQQLLRTWNPSNRLPDGSSSEVASVE